MQQLFVTSMTPVAPLVRTQAAKGSFVPQASLGPNPNEYSNTQCAMVTMRLNRPSYGSISGILRPVAGRDIKMMAHPIDRDEAWAFSVPGN